MGSLLISQMRIPPDTGILEGQFLLNYASFPLKLLVPKAYRHNASSLRSAYFSCWSPVPPIEFMMLNLYVTAGIARFFLVLNQLVSLRSLSI